VAIVTGASSGLGARFAQVLAGAGAHVIACARRVERIAELAESHPTVHPVRADVTEEDDRTRVVAAALDRFGRVDVCVNNAGVSSGGPERQASLDAFRSVLRVNLEALFALSQAVAEPMRRQGSGSVINMSSMFSFIASAPVPEAGYVASKSAVNGLTRELAVQWARDGIRVNAIAPGTIETPMNDVFAEERLEDPFADAVVRQLHPQGRMGTPEEVAAGILYLAGDLSTFATGSVLSVDGGFTAQ
jgi:NAD(P)-dependent dehydrogenase (short-subunit alcohol dehydrogenase family)